MKVAIGVDVGKNGGIIVLEDGVFKKKFMIPIIGKVVDVTSLANIFTALRNEYVDDNVCVGIEQVHAIFGCGAGTTFEFGRIYGLLEGIVGCLKFKYILVQPKTWQKEMFTGIPEIRKPGKEIKKKDSIKVIKKGSLETKKMALVASTRLFPDADLRSSERAKIPHDGLVDAILIAEWINRNG